MIMKIFLRTLLLLLFLGWIYVIVIGLFDDQVSTWKWVIWTAGGWLLITGLASAFGKAITMKN